MRRLRLLLLVIVLAPWPNASAQWVEFVDQTAGALDAEPTLVADDTEEKDYAWGDVDQDGDIDLVIVRKEPFTTAGKEPNVLLINEAGTLTDRTAEFASASDVPGDNGFLTPTNDRDVVLADLDQDGWLDIVTAPTLSVSDPKHLGHPRVYRNLGCSGACAGTGDWLGFRHEDARIPQMLAYDGVSSGNPRFCAVSAGDVTGDGYPDLYFSDYDNSVIGDPIPGPDFNDKLLINLGPQNPGFFVDQTDTRFSGVVPGISRPFVVSDFGTANVIVDLNDDGLGDIVKVSSLISPYHVGIAFSDTDNPGFFDTYDVVWVGAPYFMSAGDLNNDDLPELIITEDGADRYLINQQTGGDSVTEFVSFPFSFSHSGVGSSSSDGGFGGNSLTADLNNDGWDDVLIADVDVDVPGCGGRMQIYRNLGGTPGGVPTIQEETSGSGCATTDGSPPSCIVASIPANQLRGVHDVAAFDIDGDGWNDLVVGRCSGTEIYFNQPPVGLLFEYPQGLPFFAPPGLPYVFRVQVAGSGGAVPVAGSAKLFVAVNEGPFIESAMVDLGGDLYEASLPAGSCTDRFRFYLSADQSSGGSALDPPGAPADSFRAIAAVDSQTVVQEGFEGDVSTWTVIDDPALTGGGWEQAEPNGTITLGGEQAAPDEDAQASITNVKAFVTENGAPAGSAALSDVDGGPTDLISPAIDLTDSDADISYSRWFFTSGDDDELTVWLSGNGTDWVLVDTTAGTGSVWEVASFRVGEFIAPTGTVQVRFRTADSGNPSVVEAGIDLFTVKSFVCGNCVLPADCDDGNFCNGAEDCDAGTCIAGADACPGQACDEGTDTCADCFNDGDCTDFNFCNGAESCVANSCQPGSDPCVGEFCNEVGDVCVDCLVDGDCGDGVFCNGVESCISGVCFSPGESCPGQLCDEAGDQCLGTVQLQQRMGQPLAGLTAAELDRFEQGRQSFERVFTVPEGLGPTFNQNSCGSCHSTPLGGSGTVTVTRFGFNDDKGGGFDPLVDLGGSLLQAEAISAQCAEVVPPEANVTTLRVTNSTLGFGLVEAVADADIQANALNPPLGVSGKAHVVPILESPPAMAIGRFGWKSQLATVLSFSGDAALNEMGITNAIVGDENAPNGDTVLLAQCDQVADPEDIADGEGVFFIERVTDFQRFLAAPPQTPRSGMSGEQHFNNIGCAACHIGSFVTDDDAALEDAIRDEVIHPYSDFLLHDMGLAADFIEQGQAEGRELRTTPLWGLRVRDPLWHDGRFAGGTFASRVTAAILAHGALASEAAASKLAFEALMAQQQAELIAFLDSLGRAEFDHNGDNDIGNPDFAQFLSCFSGPVPTYTPDDPCSIFDADQDGDVDDDDRTLYLAASDGRSGAIADLRVDRDGNDDVLLSWGASCQLSDDDYGIYEGTLGAFTTHALLTCSTGGALASAPITPAGTATYYLVVPNNGVREGSYGRRSVGAAAQERAPSASACFEQSLGFCQ